MHKLNVSDEEKREDLCYELFERNQVTARPTVNVYRLIDVFGLYVTELLVAWKFSEVLAIFYILRFGVSVLQFRLRIIPMDLYLVTLW